MKFEQVAIKLREAAQAQIDGLALRENLQRSWLVRTGDLRYSTVSGGLRIDISICSITSYDNNIGHIEIKPQISASPAAFGSQPYEVWQLTPEDLQILLRAHQIVSDWTAGRIDNLPHKTPTLLETTHRAS